MFLAHFGDNVKVLKNGLRMWDRVEFLDDGSGGYKAGNSYYNEYAKHYRDEVPNALQGKVIIHKSRGELLISSRARYN